MNIAPKFQGWLGKLQHVFDCPALSSNKIYKILEAGIYQNFPVSQIKPKIRLQNAIGECLEALITTSFLV